MTGPDAWDEAILDGSTACLSRVAAEVAELCGMAVADALVRAHGGQVVYIPRRPPGPAHVLTKSLGAEAAQALATAFGGERLDVPMALYDSTAQRRLLVPILRARGLSIAAIARTAGCTQRRVFQILASAKAQQE